MCIVFILMYPLPDQPTLMLHKHDPIRINVTARFSSFEENGLQRRITPLRFTRPDGSIHNITQVRSTYSERVGDSVHIHFVVRTLPDTYFDILYDSRPMLWFLVVEVESNWIPEPERQHNGYR